MYLELVRAGLDVPEGAEVVCAGLGEHDVCKVGERDLLLSCIFLAVRSKFELVAVDCDVTYCDHQKDDK